MRVAAAVFLDLAGGAGHLRVVPDDGVELTADAPAEVAWRSAEGARTASVVGAALAEGLAVGRVSGAVEAELTLVLCTKATGACTRTTWSVAGDVGTARRGRVPLLAVERHADAFRPDADADRIFSEALSAASVRGVPLVVDFSAVWCPPCNRLAAEVLHADPRPELLDGVELAVLDADHPSSWGVKDRYAVTSYPTVLVLDPDGAERTRTLGYADRDAFLAWLQTAVEGASEASRVAAGPEAATPAEAALLAEALTRRDAPADAFIARAEAGNADDPALRAARFRARHGLDDLRWLVAHRPLSEWLGDAVSWGDPAAAPLVLPAVRAALPGSSGLDAVELLDALRLFDAEQGPAHAAAAAAVLRTTLTGDPERDKGFVTDLATFMEQAGDVTGGLRVLADAAAARPGDPTFLLNGARMANRAGRHAEALALADAAWALAWGDNRLRVAAARAEALAGLGRVDESRAFARDVLDGMVAPEADVAVRTHRYRRDLERWR